MRKPLITMVYFLFGGAVLSALSSCGGSGGGNAENRPPIATVGGLVVRGVVSVRQSAVAVRSASLESEVVVSGATVLFTVEGEDVVLSKTVSDAQGQFLLPIRAGIRGRLTVLKDRKQLSAILLAAQDASGVLERNVNLESTVVELALRNQKELSYDVEAMEEQVRIGEAPDLLAEVKAAYFESRTPAPSTEAINKGVLRLLSGESAATKDCQPGQEWCVVASAFEVGQEGGYTSRLLLRRDRTEGNNPATSMATVGAGDLVLRLPSGVTLAAVSGSVAAGRPVYIEAGNVREDATIKISFLHPAHEGLNEAVKLADFTLTSIRPLNADDRLVVENQRLFGTLNQKRGEFFKALPRHP